LIGGDIVLSPPCKWQKRFNSSDITVEDRIARPVDPKIVNDLLKKFPDFVRASTDGGIAIEDFDTFGPTARTLRQFIEACHELEVQIREFMLPNPDTM
jgi:transaldolase